MTVEDPKPKRAKSRGAKSGSRSGLAKVQKATDIDLTVPGRVVPKVEMQDGVLNIVGAEEHQAELDRVLGTGSKDFVAYAMLQLISNLKTRTDDLTMPVNAGLAFIRAINPANELEAALAANMFLTHHLSMEVLGKASRAEMLPQYEAHGNLATKLQRTFVAQLDALGRHRRGGKQVIEHVSVQAGGQAVFAGTVNSGGGQA